MTVKKRTWKTSNGETKSSYSVHIVASTPTGERLRIRETNKRWRRKDAIAYEREVRAAILNGTYGQESTIDRTLLVRDFIDEYMEAHVAVECAPSTYEDRQGLIDNHIVPFFGSMRLTDLDERAIARFKAHQKKLKYKNGKPRLSDATINNHIGVLSSMLNVAYEWRKIERVPTIKWLRLRQRDDQQLKFLDFGEAERFLEAAGSDRSILLVGLRTGMRPGELIGLKWEDVDLIKGEVIIQRTLSKGVEGPTKGGRHRTVPLSEDARDALKGLESRSKLRGVYVFSDAETGSPYTLRELDTKVRRACRVAGIKRISPKAMRHTFASHLVMRGQTLMVVQRLMGHRKLRTTQVYAHLSPSFNSDIVNCLDAPTPSWVDRGVAL